MSNPEEQSPKQNPSIPDELAANTSVPIEEVAAAAPVAEPPAPRAQEALSASPEHAPAEEELAAKLFRATEAANVEVLADSRRHTRRSFLGAAAGAAAGFSLYHYLNRPGPGNAEGQPTLLRNSFRFNASLVRGIFREHPLAPTYPLHRAENLRVNGIYGLKRAMIPESYRLQVTGTRNPFLHPRFAKNVTAWEYRYTKSASGEDEGHDTKVDPSLTSSSKMAPEAMMAKCEDDENHTGRKPRGMEESGESNSTLLPNTPGLLLFMDDLLRLPRHELVTQFKCIEGWSQIVHWGGVRMADFLDAHPPALINGKEPRYVYMETPDGDFYNGYDLDALRHPQALLVTEMMGAPLTQFHGAPVRLHLPTRYGYKQIKRIGLIAYTNDKPDDYWTKLGYDWYGGL